MASTVGSLKRILNMYSDSCAITPIVLEYNHDEKTKENIINIKLHEERLTLGQVKSMMVNPYNIPEIADEILKEWDSIAKEKHIDYVLVCGTCLGFVRDGGYIKGDNDIDICIHPKDLERTIKVMREHGFQLGRRGGSQHFIKNNILLDVWLKPIFEPPYNFIGYKGNKYPIPYNIDRYLTVLYGDWRTPSSQSAKEAVFGKYE